MKVALLADPIGFPEPAAKLLVNFLEPGQTENVQVVPGREGLHLAEAGMLEPARQHYVAVEPLLPRSDLGKGHPDLKGDPGLFRKHPDRTDRPERCHHRIEEGANLRALGAEVLAERVTPAVVGLIPVGEGPATPGATPERRAAASRAA